MWTLRLRAPREPVPARIGSARTAIPLLAATLFLSEFGDKTQLATASLASIEGSSRTGVWAEATLGMIAGDAIAIAAGRRLYRLASARVIEAVAGVLFIAFGIAALAAALS